MTNPKQMKLIVGLGNPGRDYSATRHNVGFMAVDELARRWNITNWKQKYNAEVAEYRLDGDVIMLVKPQTYMNLSGTAISELARFYKIPAHDVVVIYDDLDLPAGRLRLRTKGGSGGHRGIESLLTHMGSAEFPRIRIGIGRPQSVIGRATVPAMQSGIYWGYVGLVEGIVSRIKAEFGGPMKVIGTGGLAPLFAEGTLVIERTDPDITLEGLRLLAERNPSSVFHQSALRDPLRSDSD